jgi:hypothetical protein
MEAHHNATLSTILVVIAGVLFFLAGLGGGWVAPAPEWPWRGRLVAWGLFCWVASTFF